MNEEKTISYFYNKDTKTYTISDKEMQKINRKLKERFALKQENQQLRNALEKLKDSAGWREILELSGIIQERDKLQQENEDLREKIILLKASEPMLELEKYYGERDKYKEVINKAQEFIRNENSLNESEIDELSEILDSYRS